MFIAFPANGENDVDYDREFLKIRFLDFLISLSIFTDDNGRLQGFPPAETRLPIYCQRLLQSARVLKLRSAELRIQPGRDFEFNSGLNFVLGAELEIAPCCNWRTAERAPVLGHYNWGSTS